jgi:hypothetical protein
MKFPHTRLSWEKHVATAIPSRDPLRLMTEDRMANTSTSRNRFFYTEGTAHGRGPGSWRTSLFLLAVSTLAARINSVQLELVKQCAARQP